LQYKLRDIRLFPFFILSLFFILVFINLRSKSHSLDRLPLLGRTSPGPASAYFLDFSPAIYGMRGTVPDTGAVRLFEITANEKEETVACRLNYRLKKESELRLIFSWYRGNTAVRQDSQWISAADTVCNSVLSIPRSETGHWSVDIALKENILLKTLSFEVSTRSEPQRFRSLKSRT
jgi:hypothetical protein